MLQTIRDRAQGIFAWIILILIIVPFALWGIQNYFDTGTEKPIAVVGDREFFENDLISLYEQQFARLLNEGYGEDQLKTMALERLINEEVLWQTAIAKDMAASESQVAQFIRNLPFFQTEGRFDEEKYKRLLASQGMSSSQFVAQIQRTLLLEQLRRGIIDSAIASDEEAQRYYKLLKQRRKIAYLILPLPDKGIQVSAGEIRAYYESHPDQFQTPERVAIDYAMISIDQIARTIVPSEEELRQYYEEQKQAFVTPEQRHIRHILINVPSDAEPGQRQKALEKAQQLRQKLLEDADFAKLAKAFSDDPGSKDKGGDLGWVRRGVMEKSFEKAAFSLPKGEISPPVETPFGYHLIQVTEIQPEKIKPFEEVRDQILQAIRRQEAENRFYDLGEQLAQHAYENPQTLEPAAEALGLKIEQTGLFTRNHGEGIATNPKLRELAFSEDILAGNNSEPIELDEGAIAVIRVREYQPSKTRPLDQVSEEIATTLRRKKARQQLQAQVESLLGKLNQGEKITQIANKVKAELNTTELSRTAPELEEIATAVFKAAKPKQGSPVSLAVPMKDGRQALIQVLEVMDGDYAALKPDERRNLKTNIARLYGMLTFREYQTQLREQAKVKVNWPPSE